MKKKKGKLIRVEITPEERLLILDIYQWFKSGQGDSEDILERYRFDDLWALEEKNLIHSERRGGALLYYLTGGGVQLAQIIEKESSPFEGAEIKPDQLGRDQ